jgi:hypothetical protein
MGYLTTFTVYNDGASDIKRNPKEFGEAIYEHIGARKTEEFGVPGGSCANLVQVQETRHADDRTIYVHMGNCVTEVNPYSSFFSELIQRHPKFADELINFIEKELDILKRHMASIQTEQK